MLVREFPTLSLVLRSLMPADNGSHLAAAQGSTCPGTSALSGRLRRSPAGTCASSGDLLAELADVIITAAAAMSGITGVQWTRPAVTWNGD
jgi:hypothetical protein